MATEEQQPQHQQQQHQLVDQCKDSAADLSLAARGDGSRWMATVGWVTMVVVVVTVAATSQWALGRSEVMQHQQHQEPQQSVWTTKLQHRQLSAIPNDPNHGNPAVTGVKRMGLAVSNFPILNVGMPRSGSESIHRFFQCHGLTSAHYCCGGSTKTHFSCGTNFPSCGQCVHSNMLKGKAPFENCGDYDVFAQYDVETGDPYAWFLPQHFTLPLLHEAYPTSIWILQTRGAATTWATNVLHWYSVTNRMFNSFNVPYHANMPMNDTSTQPGKKLTGSSLYQELMNGLERAKDIKEHERRRSELIRIYEEHTATVKRFAIEYKHPLIELNVDDPHAGLVLADALLPYTVGATVANNPWKSSCFEFDAQALDNDWKDFSLKV